MFPREEKIAAKKRKKHLHLPFSLVRLAWRFDDDCEGFDRDFLPFWKRPKTDAAKLQEVVSKKWGKDGTLRRVYQ